CPDTFRDKRSGHLVLLGGAGGDPRAARPSAAPAAGVPPGERDPYRAPVRRRPLSLRGSRHGRRGDLRRAGGRRSPRRLHARGAGPVSRSAQTRAAAHPDDPRSVGRSGAHAPVASRSARRAVRVTTVVTATVAAKPRTRTA